MPCPTQQPGPWPHREGSAIRYSCAWSVSLGLRLSPAFPSSAAAAHAHWSAWLSVSLLHTSPKQPVRLARASEAELAAGGGASAVEGAAAASPLWLWTRARRHPRSSCYRCCTWSGKRVFLPGRLPHLFFPAEACLSAPPLLLWGSGQSC